MPSEAKELNISFHFNLHVTKSKFESSISNEILTSELRCALSMKYTPNLKDVVQKKVNYLINHFYIDYMLIIFLL